MGFERLRAVAVATALLLASSNAFAQQLSQQDREQARSLMEEGDKKRDGGDLKGALDAFSKADAIAHVPSIALEVARVQASLGKVIEARETAARASKMPVQSKEPAVMKEARRSADALAKDLESRIATLSVSVTGADSYTVTIDGEQVEGSKRVNPGKHTVVAKGGGATATQDVTLGDGEKKTLPLELKAETPTTEETNKDSWKSGNEKPKDDSGDSGKTLMYVGFGVGGAGILVGAVTGIMSLTKVSSVKQGCPGGVCPASSQSDIDSAKSLGTISTVSFIVGGIGAAIGIAGVVMSKKEPPPEKKKEDARIEPILGLGYAGVRGTF